MATLLAASATAFSIIKYLGAAYLIYLGLKTLMRPPSSTESVNAKNSQKLRAYFYRGVFVDLFNPKIALFFLAFLPQFLVEDDSSVLVQSIALGMVFIFTGGLVNSGIAVVAVSSLGLARPRIKVWFQRWIPGVS